MDFRYRAHLSGSNLTKDETFRPEQTTRHVYNREAFLEVINDWNRMSVVQAQVFGREQVWVYVAL